VRVDDQALLLSAGGGGSDLREEGPAAGVHAISRIAPI
jgi:hypothetical protein